jgi:hypothetical protein
MVMDLMMRSVSSCTLVKANPDLADRAESAGLDGAQSYVKRADMQNMQKSAMGVKRRLVPNTTLQAGEKRLSQLCVED